MMAQPSLHFCKRWSSLTGNEAEHYASWSLRMDDVVSRLDRIERRLELVEAPK